MKKILSVLLAVVVCAVAHAQGVESDEQMYDTAATVAEQSVEQSVAAVELTPNEARKMRGFSTDDCFVPRGQWIFGGTASYSTHANKDYNFLVISNINSEGYTVKVSPMIAYAPWKNMSVGVRFGYSRSLLSIDSGSLSFGDAETGVNINVDYYHQIKHSYTGTLFWRPYIPLGHSNRFAIFAEVQLNASGGRSKIVAEDGVIDGMQNYRGSYADSFGMSLALQPGIVAFVTNNTALELSIGVFGIGYERVKQLRNQIDDGTYSSTDMNFKVNLLSIGFGVSFYL